MLNFHARVRAALSHVLVPLGTRLARAGVTPNVVTVIGMLGAVVTAVVCYPHGWFFTGSAIITVFVLLDMVDGAIARAGGGTGSVFGAVLDSSSDRVADAAIFASITWYYAEHGQRWMVLGGLLCLILGSLTSYVRARAEAAGLTAAVGIAERTERLVAVLVGAGLTGLGVPFILAIALWLLVAASAVTVGQRIATVYVQSKHVDRVVG